MTKNLDIVYKLDPSTFILLSVVSITFVFSSSETEIVCHLQLLPGLESR